MRKGDSTEINEGRCASVAGTMRKGDRTEINEGRCASVKGGG
jgi:hypothetical protein